MLGPDIGSRWSQPWTGIWTASACLTGAFAHLQTDENEVRNIFNSQPGFRQIKLNRGQRGITCFVEFSDVASAMAVHQSQQVRLGSTTDISCRALLFSSQDEAIHVFNACN